jgi:type IV pilus assembly protein PilW
VYAVRGGNLTVCDYTNYNCGSATYATINAANQQIWVPIAGNIVSLKAQYGRNSNGGTMTGIVDLYDQTTPASSCNWVRTSAIRVALVAIGSIDVNNVITTAPVWDGSNTILAAAPLPGSTANPIDLSLVPNVTTNWKKYHYKVFQTTIPIRNITAQGVISGC